jgi:lysophospholipid acyltransferase (LPLAT)-like uncharacterized protein
MISESTTGPFWANMAALLNELKWRLVGIFGKLVIDLLFLSTRIETIGYNDVKDILTSNRFISAFWHSRILLVAHQFKIYSGTALVSRSDDGEIIARILERLGQQTVRGSTTRGGLRALVTMIRHIKQTGRPVAVVPDGPQGPRFKVQPGVITLAQKTGLPIITVTYSARRMKVFNSWDRFLLPYPFTRCRMVYGKPVYVSDDADKKQLAQAREDLDKELNRITRAADLHFKHDIQ